MTVYKIGTGKLKITLSDSEVISFFGAYRNLKSASGDTRLTVGLILKESLSDYGDEFNGDLLVEIKAREYSGCIITVSSKESRHSAEKCPHMLEFRDSSAMTAGVKQLYLKRLCEKSSLYKMRNGYRLIITARNNAELFFMNEFCTRQSRSEIDAAYTEEYGRLIAKDNAVEKIGRAFF